jgi:hypothetical protein
MADAPIICVRLDDSGRIRVRPDVPADVGDYRQVHRDASWVRWDESTSELYVTIEKVESPEDQFDRILRSVASEYGDRLLATSDTQAENLSPELAAHVFKSRA